MCPGPGAVTPSSMLSICKSMLLPCTKVLAILMLKMSLEKTDSTARDRRDATMIFVFLELISRHCKLVVSDEFTMFNDSSISLGQ